MSNQKPSFRFEIDNFSKKEAPISSETFRSDGCEWYIKVCPKGGRSSENHVSLFLYVANPKSLRTGWERSAKQYFVVLNQSDKELFRSSPKNNLFQTENPAWGFRKALPLSTLQEEGVLENDKLIIEVYIKVLEVVDGEVSEKKEHVEINGFQVLASQVTSARKLFAEHPDIAEEFKTKNKAVKTAYMNVLLNLIKKLEDLKTELDEVSSERTKENSRAEQLEERLKNLEVMELGFKFESLKTQLDEFTLEINDESWVQQLEERVKNLDMMELGLKLESLKTELDEVSLERKKENSRTQQLEERLKNLELESDFKLDSLKTKLDEVSSERKKESSRVQQLEERLKSLEAMELAFKLDSLETKLDEVSLDRNKSDDDDDSWAEEVEELEERVKNLEVMELQYKLDCVNTKLEEVSLEKKKSDDAHELRIQQVEDSVNDIRLMFLYLKAEVDKKKDKSSSDGFLLVD